jgi:V/A-type H+/Na+-transporting ATPase subunit E
METNNKIKKLTEKIHREGLEKANKEAGEIINKAKEEADQIISKAKEEADSLRTRAGKEAEETKEKVQSELRLSSRQAISSLRKEIGELIQASVLKDPLDKTFDDSKFVSGLIEIMVENWKSGGEEVELEVLVPGDKLKEMEDYFRKRSAKILNKGVSLKEYNGSGKGFEIKPANGHYKIIMTDEAFNSFLQEHFREQTLDFLFGKDS